MDQLPPRQAQFPTLDLGLKWPFDSASYVAPLQTAHVGNLVSGMLILTLTFASRLVARNFPWGPGLKFGFLKLQVWVPEVSQLLAASP